MYNEAHGMFSEGAGIVPSALSRGELWPGNGLMLIAVGAMTKTEVNCTPVFDFIGGRPCISCTGAGAATDGVQWQVPTGIYQLQTGKTAVLKASFRLGVITQEVSFGWAALDTTVIASDPTDITGVQKLTGATALQVHNRKASGTAVNSSFNPVTLAIDTWYDLEYRIKKTDTGQGQATLFLGNGLSPGGQMTSYKHDLGSQVPDTVDLAPYFAWRAGSAAAVTGYFGYFGWSIEG